MARLTSELVVRLLDQVTKPAQAVSRAFRGISDARDRAEQRMDNIRGRMVDAVGAGYVLTNALRAPISAAIDFESSMADVRKVVDFPTPGSFEQMGRDIRNLSLETPMAADGIAQIVAAAGQSGLAQNELLDFAKMAAQVGVAWDVSADVAGESLAKLKTALNLSVADTGLLADAINELGNRTAASAPDILNMVRRVAGSAQTFGISAEQAAAFGSAMIGSGFEAEVAATSFLNMGRALTRGASATTRQRGALKALGLDAENVAKAMQRDAMGTIQDIFERINRLPEHMRASLMSDYFGDEARALTPLITTQGLLANSLSHVADEATYAGSAFAEYEVRSKTTANAIQLFKNLVNDLGITIGSVLLPPLNETMAAMAPFVKGVAAFADANPVLTRNLIIGTSALVAFRIAAVATQWVLGMSALSFLTAASNAVRFGSALGFLATPFRRVGSAFGRLGSQIVTGFRLWRVGAASSAEAIAFAFAGTGRALLRLLNPIHLVRAALVGLRFAVIGTGIGAALVGIAVAGAWIYNNWRGITTAFEAFTGAFSRAIDPIRPALEPVLSVFGSVGDAISKIVGLTDRVDPMGGKWAAFGISLGKNLGEAFVSVVEGARSAVNFITGIPGQLAAIHWGDVTAGLVAEFLAMPYRLLVLPAQILEIFTGIDLTSAAVAMINTFVAGVKAGILELAGWVKSKIADMFSINVSMPAWLGGGGGGAAKPAGGSAPAAPIYEPAPDIMRAKGGPVSAGETYVVGDGGEPEFFTPHADGFVTPMSKAADLERRAMARAGQGASRAPAAGQGGRAFTYSPSYTISASMDPNALRALLDQHDRDAQRRFESMQDGAFADS